MVVPEGLTLSFYFIILALPNLAKPAIVFIGELSLVSNLRSPLPYLPRIAQSAGCGSSLSPGSRA